ncbi:WxcM-like, C-terminal [Psychroflexus salarius]|uniref:WxcM-like, C-terminal n=1 Tax=Psychroflexus salarius TaxID=1155689 RepID=A0A1M4V522_9FLAO|nr:FdtA/QdtA family cupin domain-containing protein [Psychroflexus salarius]SHE64020.1 WxcM-like, C-terminal [Psychroflexus salarius]
MLNQVKLLKLPKIEDDRGNLTFLQENTHIPFQVERVFWTYDVPGGEQRGGHAYHQQEEIIIALSGSIDVVITNKSGEKDTYQLNRSYNAIYIPPKTWRHIENHSTNAVTLHLSSHKFDAEDYIRNFSQL